MKKTKIFSTLLTLSFPLTSFVAISCKDNENNKPSENAGFQTNFLKEPGSRGQIINSLLDNYINIFYKEDLKTIKKEKNNEDVILKAIKNKDSQLHKDLYDIFKQYAAKKLDENSQVFWNLKYDFIKLNIDISSFNPTPKTIPTVEEFIFIMENSKLLNLNWRLEIQKLLISKLYLLKSREEFKKLSNNANGLDKYQVSLESEIKKNETNKTKKDIYNALDLSANNLYLIKYLVENPFIQKWAFTDTQDMDLRSGQAKVSNFNEFNALAGYTSDGKVKLNHNPVAKRPEFIIATGKSEITGMSKEYEELKGLRAYKGIEKNSFTTGDLANTIDAIKNTKSPIFGFLNPNTNQVLDQDYFKFASILAKEKTLPKIKAAAQLSSRASKLDNLKDFNAKDIEFDGLTRDLKKDKLFTKEINNPDTGNNNHKKYKLQFEINGDIVFSGGVDGILRVPMRLSVEGLGKRHYYDFNSTLKYNKEKKEFEPESTQNDYNLDKYPTYVNMIKNNTIDAAYVVKIAPMYISKKFKDNKNKEITKQVLSLEQTPWNDKEEQSKIANHIIISKGNELFREANKYILDNLGFKLSDINPIVLDILKSEGIL